MLNLVSEVKDLPNAVVWRPKEKEDAMFSAEIFRSKIASPNDVHRAQHLMYLVGIGLEEKTQGVVDEGGAIETNQDKAAKRRILNLVELRMLIYVSQVGLKSHLSDPLVRSVELAFRRL